jgi:phytoene desaturase
MGERRVRAAVCGSGFGGLAAAIRLQAAGIDTTLFEARDKPGGRAYVYHDRGFVFDAGPTVITAPGCLEELFTLAGRRLADYVELVPVRPFYRLIWEDGDCMDYAADLAAMLEEIQQRSPRDVEGYLRFLAYTREVFRIGYDGLAATPFPRLRDMARVLPSLLRLRSDRSVYRTVARFVHDERLRQALSFHALLIGGDPFRTSAIYTLIHALEREWGVFFARGGTGRLVAALIRLFGELGGETRLGCPVRHIEVRNGTHRVTSEGARHEPFDLVVSNADVHHTYATLYRGTPHAGRMQRKLESLEWSMSLFVLYFGTDRPYPDLAHHTVLFGPRYRELLQDIAAGPGLSEDFSLYLHAPTVTDPSLAPPGGATFYVLSPVPHLGRSPIDWTAAAEPYAERILASLERLLPDLRRHIVTRRWFTPVDFARELAAFNGSAFSLAPRLGQSAWFRPHNRDPRIHGLYLVGAGTHPGAGIPGVVNSAKATVGLIASDLGLRGAAA